MCSCRCTIAVSAIISYSPLLLNVSPCRNKMAFWCKICCFWEQEFFRTHTFQAAFSDFRQDSSFFAYWWWKKGRACFSFLRKGRVHFWLLKKGRAQFWLLKEGRGHFWLLRKGQGAAPSEKRKTWTLCTIHKPEKVMCKSSDKTAIFRFAGILVIIINSALKIVFSCILFNHSISKIVMTINSVLKKN